jgi:hypothetical protein
MSMVKPKIGQTRSGHSAHIWRYTEKYILGAWLGNDGWWRATVWRPDGRVSGVESPQDLDMRLVT